MCQHCKYYQFEQIKKILLRDYIVKNHCLRNNPATLSKHSRSSDVAIAAKWIYLF